MADFQEILSNFLWLGLFIIAGLGFIFVLQSDNSAVQPLAADQNVNVTFTSLNSNLSALQGTSGTQYTQFSNEQPKTGFFTIVLFGILSFGKTFGTIIFAIFNIIVKFPLIILGIPQSVFAVVVTWIVIVTIIGSWILYKIGG